MTEMTTKMAGEINVGDVICREPDFIFVNRIEQTGTLIAFYDDGAKLCLRTQATLPFQVIEPSP